MGGRVDLGEESAKMEQRKGIRDQEKGIRIARVEDWIVVIVASHLRLLPLCAWRGKLSAKQWQWSVIRGQWSGVSGGVRKVSGRACGTAGALRAWGWWFPRSPKARDLGHPDLWVGTCTTRHRITYRRSFGYAQDDRGTENQELRDERAGSSFFACQRRPSQAR